MEREEWKVRILKNRKVEKRHNMDRKEKNKA